MMELSNPETRRMFSKLSLDEKNITVDTETVELMNKLGNFENNAVDLKGELSELTLMAAGVSATVGGAGIDVLVKEIVSLKQENETLRKMVVRLNTEVGDLWAARKDDHQRAVMTGYATGVTELDGWSPEEIEFGLKKYGLIDKSEVSHSAEQLLEMVYKAKPNEFEQKFITSSDARKHFRFGDDRKAAQRLFNKTVEKYGHLVYLDKNKRGESIIVLRR
ncbi:hypothetical protein [Methanolapillus millepedarum]|uniref:Uncharacterized protein n=1 Tax=Methanolapillus millepedarum TaxID=3028296 RepID=A0AA96V587_9EURY|nr:hypothetical protein MsAc7_17280 [Methanosarcinaceae archaeon Ac7]